MRKFKAIVHETDERMFFLSDMLKDLLFDNITHVFAPNVLIDARALNNVEDSAFVYCGQISDEGEHLANSRDITLVNYAKNEKFQAINSRLTAEGALKEMIEHCNKSVLDCKTLILGFGRTGSALARLLDRLGADFDVATNSSMRPAYAFANKVVALCEFDFAPYDVIVNTVPSAIVSDKEVLGMKKDCVYVELASKPAINLDFARHIGIDAEIYPALPAKTCPYSASKAIFDAIMEVKK